MCGPRGWHWQLSENDLEFLVEITEPALLDAEEYVQFIREVKGEPDAAERWFRGLMAAIFSLEEIPERCPLIPERASFPFEVRHLIYFSHRILFKVQPDIRRVVVYRVYHGSRLRLQYRDLF